MTVNFNLFVQENILATINRRGLSIMDNYCIGSNFPTWSAATVSEPDESAAVMRVKYKYS